MLQWFSAQFRPTCRRKQTQSRGPHLVTLVPLRRRRASYVPFDHPCPADDSWGNAPLALPNSSPHFIGAEPGSGAQSGRSPGFELRLRVHGKYRHGDSPSGGQAKEQKAPGLEVLFPAILAGIEEPADSTILWVAAGQVRSLVKIADPDPRDRPDQSTRQDIDQPSRFLRTSCRVGATSPLKVSV
jgi:hypothetical protein